MAYGWDTAEGLHWTLEVTTDIQSYQVYIYLHEYPRVGSGYGLDRTDKV